MVTATTIEAPSRKRPANTAERVAAELRQAILHGELLPGEHVRQEIWATRIGISRAPIREGMKILVAERVLTYDTHRGYFVTKLDPHEMEQVYLMRRLLEAEVLRSIAWPDAARIEEMRALAAETVDRLRNDDVHGTLDGARALAFALYDQSPLELVVAEVKRLWAISDVYRALAFGSARLSDPDARNLSEMHRKLFDCLESGDRDGLVEFNSRMRLARVSRFLAEPGLPGD